MKDSTSEPEADSELAVAIVGMAGRFPGARTATELWRRLCSGDECLTAWTPSQLSAAGVDPALLQRPSYVPVKGEVADMDCFDAAFFGVTPREAELTDPQHRHLLECAWEAMEDAGYDPRAYPGTVGVYVGKSLDTYLLLNVAPHFPQGAFDAQTLKAALGNDKDSLATFLAYHLDLTGPAIAVQTSSSTSLVAVCLAVQSLLCWQCDAALAGGVALGPPSGTGYLAEPGGITSLDGHCRAFDARSSGFVPGMGLGLVVLKRLSDALRDHDHIYALIRGFAVNNDGRRKVGYTAPSVEAQARVVTQALHMARVSPNDIGYVEAHGTGTRLGDPIEVAALNRVFARGAFRPRSCALGSVKTNIGHLDTAAGIAGLLKAALAVRHGQIPPSLHFETPNPEIDFGAGPFYVNTRLAEWSTPGAPRRAGVTSLGMGGTNAHVILEQAPPLPARTGAGQSFQLFVCSARSAGSLDRSLARLAEQLGEASGEPLGDVAFTLATGRRHFDQRAAVVASTPAEMAARLEAARSSRALRTRPKGVRVGSAEHPPRPICFLFPGQGSLLPNMARGLYAAENCFAAAFDRCANELRGELGVDLREALREGGALSSRFAESRLAQPLVFSIELALVELWRSLGIRPAALIGHSLGELTAATVAGVFPLPLALRLVTERGRRMAEAPEGRMLAVGLPADQLGPLLGEGLTLAAINAPQRCVVAGATQRVDELAQLLRQRRIPCAPLSVAHAFHTPAMAEPAAHLASLLRGAPLHHPSIPIYSTVSAHRLGGPEAIDPQWWQQQTLSPVRFAAAVQSASSELDCVFLEVGPGRALSGFTQETLGPGAEHRVLSSLPAAGSDDEEHAVFLDAVAALWCEGHAMDWARRFPAESHWRVSLPTYPFERTRYWLDSPPLAQPSGSVERAAAPPLATTKPAGGGVQVPRRLLAPLAAPQTRLEADIAAALQEMLGISEIGIDDNIFELGGDSLLLVSLSSRLSATYGAELPIAKLFARPTVRSIAELLGARPEGSDALLESLLNQVEEGQ